MSITSVTVLESQPYLNPTQTVTQSITLAQPRSPHPNAHPSLNINPTLPLPLTPTPTLHRYLTFKVLAVFEVKTGDACREVLDIS